MACLTIFLIDSFFCSNAAGSVISSNGMREEYEIAKTKGLFLIPVGLTGYMAQELWSEVYSEFVEGNFARGQEIKKQLGLLGEASSTLVEARTTVMNIISLLKN